jgi:hypothetical protein
MRMPLESRRLQYRPRELYVLKKSAYRLTGGLVPKNAGLLVTSQMPRGRVFVDGAHMNLSFSYGKKAFISLSPDYVQLIHA